MTILRRVPPVLILAYAALSILELRSLHADGSWAFLQSMLAEGYWVGDPTRIVANMIAQTPFSLLAALGVDDRTVLEYAQGVGYLLVPSAAWACALIVSRRWIVFDFLLLGYCVTTLNSGFLAVGDYNFLYAFSALCFAALTRYWLHPSRSMAWLALGSALVVMSSHGLAVLLAPLLLVAIALPWRRLGRPVVARGPITATGVILVIGTLVGIWSIVHPYSPGNVVRAADLGSPLAANHQLQLTVIWLLLLPLAVLARHRGARLVAAVVLIAGSVALALAPALWSSPLQQYLARSWSGILLFLLLLMALLVVLPQFGRQGADEEHQGEEPGRRLQALVLVLFAALLVLAVIQTVQFGAYVRDFQVEVDSRTGLVRNIDFVAAVPAAERFGWMWTYPTTSLVLGTTPEHAVVLNPTDSFYEQPFDPARPPSIPSRFDPS